MIFLSLYLIGIPLTIFTFMVWAKVDDEKMNGELWSATIFAAAIWPIVLVGTFVYLFLYKGADKVATLVANLIKKMRRDA